MRDMFLIILLAVIVSACTDNFSDDDRLMLVKSDKALSFTMDETMKTKIFTLFPYTHSDGKEYLTFQNQNRNEIVFFDMDTQQIAFRIEPELDGPDGIGFLSGYTILNLDSIFVATQGKNEISLINSRAEVKDRYPYQRTEDGITLYYNSFSSFRYTPAVIIDGRMYFFPITGRNEEVRPVSVAIDLKTKKVDALSGFQYPVFPKTDNKAKMSGSEGDLSRCFDGERFVYSFWFGEDIYVTSIDHHSVRAINVKSRYINQIEYTDDYGNLTFEDLLEAPHYGNLIYDSYREVYYRVAYPKVESDKGINGLELLEYGRKRFSIIILDKDFHIIGETLFPDYTYNNSLMFVREDGLYLSASHFMNPQYSDDRLVFHRFDLQDKK